MALQNKTAAFKAYDIRGELGVTLDAELTKEIGAALVTVLGFRRVAVGADARPSSPELKQAMIDGIKMAGADVIDIGASGTEEVYFAAQYLDVDGGVEITASHNPIGDNGMKFVKKGGAPVNGEELIAIRDCVVNHAYIADQFGELSTADIVPAYVDHLLTYINPNILAKYKIVTNAGNGMAGHVIDAIENKLAEMGIVSPFVKMHHEVDSNFPNGIPNPLLPENRPPTIAKLKAEKADLAIAWDGDFDRCFFFDENGAFIEGYYVVGLLAEAFIRKNPGAKIVYDNRLTWNSIERAEKAGGQAVASKTGHSFIKAKMREVDAIYGGEMSAHHYFREFGSCDSGMIPWLLIVELMAETGKTLGALVQEMQAEYPCSGEINFRVANASEVLKKIETYFENEHPNIDRLDGLGFEFADWRFNIRSSNTEPLLRLNVEARNNVGLMQEKTELLKKLITE